MNEPTFDPAAAETVHYVDPRVRQLASARWRLKTGGTHQQWLALGKENPDALISEALDWVRAAVAAGIIPAPWTNLAHKRLKYDPLKAEDWEGPR